MPNPEAGLKALEALLKAAAEQAPKAVKYLPSRMTRSLPETIRGARMEAELAGSRAGALRGVEGEVETPSLQGLLRYLRKKKAAHFEPSERADIKSAVNLGAGEATSGFSFFDPMQRPLERAIKSRAGREVARTVPTMGLIPKSEELQKTLSLINKIINAHQVKFGEMPSDRLISRFLRTKYGQNVDPATVQSLRAGIVPKGGPYAEAGQLPKGEVRLDAPDLMAPETEIGEHIPAGIKEAPEAYGKRIGSLPEFTESRKAEFSGSIEKLTEKQRRALMAYYAEGKTQQQIATEMGISQKNVNKLIQKAVEHIKPSKLIKGGGGPTGKSISGGGGNFPGTSPAAIFRSPQRTAMGNVLPPLSDLYGFLQFRGQPPFRSQLARHRAGLGPIEGPAGRVVSSAAEGILPEMQPWTGKTGGAFRPAEEGAKAAERSNPAQQLRELQDLFTRLFMTQSRQ